MRVPPFVAERIRWDTIQQLIRTACVGLAGWLLGADWAEDPMVANAVAGAIAIVTLFWWKVWNGARGSEGASEPVAPAAPVPEQGTTTTVTTKTEKTPEAMAPPTPKPKKET